MNKKQRLELRKVFDRARAKAGGNIADLAAALDLPRTTVASLVLALRKRKPGELAAAASLAG
jgi:hypothetical protein